MEVIGITGPTGAGKTTVLNAFAGLGSVILDCDAIYHDLTEHCEPMRRELRERYGDGIFDEAGHLLRKALGAVVFDDAKALADLNGITHRYVSQSVLQSIRAAEEVGRPAVVIDAIALLESGLGELCHKTVAVVADDEVRVRRIMARDGISEEYARLRISAQKPGQYFEERCDYTLRNDGEDPTVVEQQARALFEKLIHHN